MPEPYVAQHDCTAISVPLSCVPSFTSFEVDLGNLVAIPPSSILCLCIPLHLFLLITSDHADHTLHFALHTFSRGDGHGQRVSRFGLFVVHTSLFGFKVPLCLLFLIASEVSRGSGRISLPRSTYMMYRLILPERGKGREADPWILDLRLQFSRCRIYHGANFLFCLCGFDFRDTFLGEGGTRLGPPGSIEGFWKDCTDRLWVSS